MPPPRPTPRPASGPASGPAPRLAAAALLREVLAGHGPLDEGAWPALLPADPPGRARALRLARNALRHLGRADAALDPLMARTPPPPLRAILRVAMAEAATGGAPAPAVVDAIVSALKRHPRMNRQAGMANAVLRRALGPEGLARWHEAGPHPLPDWIARRLSVAFGPGIRAAIEAAHERGAPLDLTPRTAGDAAALAAASGAVVLPTGSLRLSAPGQVSALPGHAEGAFWVQAAAAAIPARALAPRPGMRLLDLCAAPGGKTLQLAAAGADVTALDLSPARLARLRENLSRTGLAARIVAADALEWAPETPFDAILLDAPCTATGTIRRHPDLIFHRDESALAPLVALQARLLERAAGWLAPGGRLVYATCSLLPEEGEAQAARATAHHAGLVQEPLDPVALGLPPEAAAPGGALRLRPDMWPAQGGMDGFYIAAFRKDGGPDAGHADFAA
ncbi:MAG: methyltransferase domain-containing protein [Rhodobacteraceae bacterium]|nr:methyltransferase domain-containing protein [Paracoccaceae bacterium]